MCSIELQELYCRVPGPPGAAINFCQYLSFYFDVKYFYIKTVSGALPMSRDTTDAILDQWSEERPELDTAPLGVVIRIMALHRSFSREAGDALGPVGLELWEYDVLSALRRQGSEFALAASALARETGLSTGAMTNRVDRLVNRGLVRRRVGATDRRSVIIRLTSKGRKVIDEAIKYRLDAAHDSLTDLTSVERKQLANLLRKVVKGTAAEAC